MGVGGRVIPSPMNVKIVVMPIPTNYVVWVVSMGNNVRIVLGLIVGMMVPVLTNAFYVEKVDKNVVPLVRIIQVPVIQVILVIWDPINVFGLDKSIRINRMNQEEEKYNGSTIHPYPLATRTTLQNKS